MSQPTSTGRRGSIQVHRSWLANPDLGDTALRLMLWLDSHSDEYLAEMNVARASNETGWSRNRIIKATAELEDLKLISTEQIQRPGGGTVTRFTLHLTRWSEPVDAVPERNTAVCRNGTSAVVRSATPTTRTSLLEDRDTSSNNFDVGTLVKAAEKLRIDTPKHKQQRIDRAKAERLTNQTPQPPIELAALALLGEEQSLIRWRVEQEARQDEPEPDVLTRDERDQILLDNRSSPMLG